MKAAAQVYDDFVASFQDTGKQQKTWVKGGTVNPGAAVKHETNAKAEKKKLYKPTSKLAELAATFQSSNSQSNSAKKPKRDEKKKSQLEQFKEELKQIQREREERHRIKKILRGEIPPDPGESVEPQDLNNSTKYDPLPIDDKSGPFADPNDDTTTNIYVGNINPKRIVQRRGNIVTGTFWTKVRNLYDSIEEKVPARKLAIYEAFQRKDDRGEGNNKVYHDQNKI
ncbi:Hypothetical predicted protein [Mytilus galloprovincialis]|uniref:Uncharacterized protein n=1 Tax=Mytilus galloprovincialis TaxID=29158 RepID=A0A8B6EM57_MYTGA|nr:Hypothetical predicted protein [Mytilus galloprovincialis]